MKRVRLDGRRELGSMRDSYVMGWKVQVEFCTVGEVIEGDGTQFSLEGHDLKSRGEELNLVTRVSLF